MIAHISAYADPDEVNLVNDQWSSCRSYRALIGGPNGPTKPEEVPAFVAKLYEEDFPRAERLRKRVDDIVKDQETAEALKHWYGTWCKRPTFHDDYLPCFNQSNVKLVDTNGKGVDKLTATGATVNGQEYPLDILIFSTGFRSPGIGGPAARAGMKITGRNGKDMDAKWNEGVATLHGMMTHDFPNILMPGPFQCGATANQNFVHHIMSDHAATIYTQAQARYPGKKIVIEATKEAEEAWTGEILKRGLAFSALGGCTPGYLNGEGMMDSLPTEYKMKAARMGIWGEGILSFTDVLERWEKDERLEGLTVTSVT
jgi:hypothetical protein